MKYKPMTKDAILTKLDTCSRYLAACTSAEDAKEIMDMADAARVYAKRKKAGIEVCNKAAEYRLRAERKLGEILQSAGNIKKGRPNKCSKMEHLSDLGIDRKTSARAQSLAAVPVEDFEEAIQPAEGEEISPAKVTKKLASKKAEEEQILDATGYPVPEPVRELWGRRDEAKAILQMISAARSKVRGLQGLDDPLYREVNCNQVLAKLNDAYREFAQAVPHAVCPYCQGWGGKKCANGFCKDRGLVSAFRLKMVPEELMAIREKGCK